MQIGWPLHLDRLLGPVYGTRPVIAVAPRPGPGQGPAPKPGPFSPLPSGLVERMTLPDEPLRAAREDGVLDQQARVQAFVELPEAAGLARLAVELADSDVTIEQARAVLRSSRRRGSGAAAGR